MEKSHSGASPSDISGSFVLPLRKTSLYIINLPNATARRESLSSRLQYHGLEDQVTWIEAVGRGDPLIEFYRGSYSYPPHPLNEGEIGCFASHVKALETFLESGEEQGIILEDDCVFHNNFRTLYDKRMAGIPSGTSLVMLSHYVTDWKNIEKVREDLGRIGPSVLCTLGYWITKEYAAEAVKRYKKPFHEIELPEEGPRLTSEHITRFSNGLFLHPPLLVDESLESAIRPSHEMGWHKKYYEQYSFESFSAADRAVRNIPLLQHWGLESQTG